MPKTLDRNELRQLVEKLPKDKVLIAQSFLLWLYTPESLTDQEWQEVVNGEQAYQKGDYVKWRQAARTL